METIIMIHSQHIQRKNKKKVTDEEIEKQIIDNSRDTSNTSMIAEEEGEEVNNEIF